MMSVLETNDADEEAKMNEGALNEDIQSIPSSKCNCSSLCDCNEDEDTSQNNGRRTVKLSDIVAKRAKSQGREKASLQACADQRCANHSSSCQHDKKLSRADSCILYGLSNVDGVANNEPNIRLPRPSSGATANSPFVQQRIGRNMFPVTRPIRIMRIFSSNFSRPSSDSTSSRSHEAFLKRCLLEPGPLLPKHKKNGCVAVEIDSEDSKKLSNPSKISHLERGLAVIAENIAGTVLKNIDDVKDCSASMMPKASFSSTHVNNSGKNLMSDDHLCLNCRENSEADDGQSMTSAPLTPQVKCMGDIAKDHLNDISNACKRCHELQSGIKCDSLDSTCHSICKTELHPDEHRLLTEFNNESSESCSSTNEVVRTNCECGEFAKISSNCNKNVINSEQSDNILASKRVIKTVTITKSSLSSPTSVATLSNSSKSRETSNFSVKTCSSLVENKGNCDENQTQHVKTSACVNLTHSIDKISTASSMTIGEKGVILEDHKGSRPHENSYAKNPRSADTVKVQQCSSEKYSTPLLMANDVTPFVKHYQNPAKELKKKYGGTVRNAQSDGYSAVTEEEFSDDLDCSKCTKCVSCNHGAQTPQKDGVIGNDTGTLAKVQHEKFTTSSKISSNQSYEHTLLSNTDDFESSATFSGNSGIGFGESSPIQSKIPIRNFAHNTGLSQIDSCQKSSLAADKTTSSTPEPAEVSHNEDEILTIICLGTAVGINDSRTMQESDDILSSAEDNVGYRDTIKATPLSSCDENTLNMMYVDDKNISENKNIMDSSLKADCQKTLNFPASDPSYHAIAESTDEYQSSDKQITQMICKIDDLSTSMGGSAPFIVNGSGSENDEESLYHYESKHSENLARKSIIVETPLPENYCKPEPIGTKCKSSNKTCLVGPHSKSCGCDAASSRYCRDTNNLTESKDSDIKSHSQQETTPVKMNSEISCNCGNSRLTVKTVSVSTQCNFQPVSQSQVQSLPKMTEQNNGNDKDGMSSNPVEQQSLEDFAKNNSSTDSSDANHIEEESFANDDELHVAYPSTEMENKAIAYVQSILEETFGEGTGVSVKKVIKAERKLPHTRKRRKSLDTKICKNVADAESPNETPKESLEDVTKNARSKKSTTSKRRRKSSVSPGTEDCNALESESLAPKKKKLSSVNKGKDSSGTKLSLAKHSKVLKAESTGIRSEDRLTSKENQSQACEMSENTGSMQESESAPSDVDVNLAIKVDDLLNEVLEKPEVNHAKDVSHSVIPKMKRTKSEKTRKFTSNHDLDLMIHDERGKSRPIVPRISATALRPVLDKGKEDWEAILQEDEEAYVVPRAKSPILQNKKMVLSITPMEHDYSLPPMNSHSSVDLKLLKSSTRNALLESDNKAKRAVTFHSAGSVPIPIDYPIADEKLLKQPAVCIPNLISKHKSKPLLSVMETQSRQTITSCETIENDESFGVESSVEEKPFSFNVPFSDLPTPNSVEHGHAVSVPEDTTMSSVLPAILTEGNMDTNDPRKSAVATTTRMLPNIAHTSVIKRNERSFSNPEFSLEAMQNFFGAGSRFQNHNQFDMFGHALQPLPASKQSSLSTYDNLRLSYVPEQMERYYEQSFQSQHLRENLDHITKFPPSSMPYGWRHAMPLSTFINPIHPHYLQLSHQRDPRLKNDSHLSRSKYNEANSKEYGGNEITDARSVIMENENHFVSSVMSHKSPHDNPFMQNKKHSPETAPVITKPTVTTKTTIYDDTESGSWPVKKVENSVLSPVCHKPKSQKKKEKTIKRKSNNRDSLQCKGAQINKKSSSELSRSDSKTSDENSEEPVVLPALQDQSKSYEMLHGISCKDIGKKFQQNSDKRRDFKYHRSDQSDLPASILNDRHQREFLKRSGECFVQDAPCCEIPKVYGVETSGPTYGFQSWSKCRECRSIRPSDSMSVFCRFYGFRKLNFVNNVLCTAGFLQPEECTNLDLQLWLPQVGCFHEQLKNADKDILSPNDPLNEEMLRFILSNIAKRFCDIVRIEKKAMSWISPDEVVFWKKPVSGVREMCDVCETTLFNFHWICQRCGYGVCLDCYERRMLKSSKEQAIYDSDRSNCFRWERCVKGKNHFHSLMLPTQIIPSTCLMDLCDKMHEVCSARNIPCRCKQKSSKKSNKDIQTKKGNRQDRPSVNGNESPPARKSSNSELESSSEERRLNLEPNAKERKVNGSTVGGDVVQPSICLVDLLRKSVWKKAHTEKASSPTKDCTANEPFQNEVAKDSIPDQQWLCDGRLLQLTDSQHPANMDLFKKYWKLGMPVLVSGVGKYLNMELWRPERLSHEYGDENSKNSLVNCVTGSIITNMKIRDFWDGFENISHRLLDEDDKTMILKLKDWPPTEAFHDVMPEMFEDLMHALPLPEYTYVGGMCNLASRLPHFFVKPDLGPKMYNAYGWVTETNWKQGTTNLHLDISDAVNVMVYVGIPQDEPPEAKERLMQIIDEGEVDEIQHYRAMNEKPGALWHIFHQKDVDNIRKFIKKVCMENGEMEAADHDPIHDQQMYLDKELRHRLKEEYDVEGYGIVQCEGDGVFIPAGAPHQVFNLHSCIKIAEDFVSPEHVDKCFTLTNEFRYLSSTHSNHEDKLQIKNIIYHAVKDIVSSALHKHCV